MYKVETSVQCTICIKWIYTRCSGDRGGLSLGADRFRCKGCDGTLKEDDLAGDLVVDMERHMDVQIAFIICETLFMEMVGRILLLQLESEMDG